MHDQQKDNYNVFESLRRASDYEAQRKHFALADALYRRQADLLGKKPESALGISNAFSQLARMYSYAKKYDQAKQAYAIAIAALKTNPQTNPARDKSNR